MTTTDRGDSGTQPTPHYCEYAASRLDPSDLVIGCPAWPACQRPAVRQAIDDDPLVQALRALDDDGGASWTGVGLDLAVLAGWAVGAVLLIAVVALLAPLFSR